MSNFLTSVKVKRPQSSTFNLSHAVKTTFDMGYLIPVLTMETLPNDRITIGSEQFARFQALVAPVMDRFDVTTETFYIPYRILWPNWQKFMMSLHDGSIAPAMPYFTNKVVETCDLSDYLGLPLGTIDKMNAFAHAAYSCVYNYWYRNPAVQDEQVYELTDGNNDSKWENLRYLRKKNWNSDLFTRALPAAQAGNPVTLPIGELADVSVVIARPPGGGSAQINNVDATPPFAGNQLDVPLDGHVNDGTNPNVNDSRLWAKTSSLASLTAVKVSELRLAFRMQEFAEKTMRVLGGRFGKYIDFMKGMFGADVPDATLQMPKYLGGTSQPMVINGVTQTSETSTTPLGDLAGQGVSIGAGNSFSYHCSEHGIIMTLACLRPKTSYQQGIPVMYDKFDPIDFGVPDFAHLTEQPIKNKYVFNDPADGLNEQTFAFQPIYSDYRWLQSRTHGQFRTSMNAWTATRIFPTRPAFNAEFMHCSPAKRNFAVTDLENGSQIQMQIYHHIKVNRQLPFHGTPIT